jgi:transmembrane sensor
VRLVRLKRGRANFSMIPLQKRPFMVEAAEIRVIGAQASFDVSLFRGATAVTVIDGEANLVSSAVSRPIRQGERFTAVADSQALVDRPDLGPVLAWHVGQAVFDNETLSAAIEEMNRYSQLKLVIPDPSVAALKISGVYRVGNNAGFAESISRLLPVTMVRDGDSIALK